MSGCAWPAVSALCQALCPCLKLLDLSRVEDLKDSHLRELLLPPADTRTGETPPTRRSVGPLLTLCSVIGSAHGEGRAGRFQNLSELRLSGLDLSDSSSRLLVRYTPQLRQLDLSHCANITDQTVLALTSPLSPLRDSLTHISLGGKRSPVPPPPPPSPADCHVRVLQVVPS